MEVSFLTQLSSIAMTNHLPVTGQFELTPVCNMKCNMCYIHQPNEDDICSRSLLPASFWLSKAKDMKDAGTLVLSLTGGETLLYPEIDELMEGLLPMGFMISFNTNGTLIDEDRVRWFKKYAPTKINITLYGASNETYQKLCGIRDGFDRVSHAIELLQDAGLNVYLNCVIVPENVQDLEAMHAYANSHNLVLHVIPYIFPTKSRCLGMDVNHAKYRLSAEDAAKVYLENLRYTCDQKTYKNMLYMLLSQMMVYKQELEKGHTFDFSSCRGGQCDYAINWRGELLPCVMLTKDGVSLKNHAFMDAWHMLCENMGDLPVPDKCKNCYRIGICPACKASIYQEGGSFTEASTYLCRYSEEIERLIQEELR